MTHGTPFAGRKETVNDDQFLTGPARFIAQQGAKPAMRSIGKRTTQLGFRKSLHVQVFDGDGLEAVDQAPALLVQKSGSAVGDLPVDAGQTHPGFAAVPPARSCARQTPVCATQHAHLSAGKARVGNSLAGTQDREVRETSVHPNGRCDCWNGFGPFRLLMVGNKGHEPVTGRILLEGCGLGRTFDGSMLAQAHRADFGDNHLSIPNRDALRDAEAERIALLRLEARIARTVLEKVRECLLQIAQRLLQQLAINLAQPGRCWLLFQGSQFLAQPVERETVAVGAVECALPIQTPVPRVAPRSRKPEQGLFLVAGRFHAELIGFLDRAHSSSTAGVCDTYRHITRLKPLKRVKPCYPRAKAPGLYGLGS